MLRGGGQGGSFGNGAPGAVAELNPKGLGFGKKGL